ncbi:phosphoribosylformylglycinamidine cyclo-ligase [Apilactobacillus sp. TMW 2.2457]|nr:phosphoribosylformylglycinamidine cyclo-ligase [Apilactobacillus xinyiensis]MCL0329539.1 phosphoribosylformylglycinamidine cyclo-ligase [Apilactobacillus xinyiensis]
MRRITILNDQYKAAGVNIEAGAEAVNDIKSVVKSTQDSNVLSGIGGFGAEYAIGSLVKNMSNPVLVSGTDGVGTKLMLAIQNDRNEHIGVDLVAMCVNDILSQGATPMFFLDYLSTGALKPDHVAKIVQGIAEGCKQGHLSLIGGEMAEMPGMYRNKDYDLSGFAVGMVDKDKMLGAQKVSKGDILIGLPSSGIHSNGYSLVRKIIKDNDLNIEEYRDDLKESILDAVMRPTNIYYSDLKPLLDKNVVNAAAHITGGGILDNLARIIPTNLTADVYEKAWHRPAIFDLLQKYGNVNHQEMHSVFNMGIGMILAVNPQNLNVVKKYLGDKGLEIGEVVDQHDNVSVAIS